MSNTAVCRPPIVPSPRLCSLSFYSHAALLLSSGTTQGPTTSTCPLTGCPSFNGWRLSSSLDRTALPYLTAESSLFRHYPYVYFIFFDATAYVMPQAPAAWRLRRSPVVGNDFFF